MKKLMRVFALVMALLMVVSAFAACQNNGNGDGDGTTTETPTTTATPNPDPDPLPVFPSPLPIEIANGLKLASTVKNTVLADASAVKLQLTNGSVVHKAIQSSTFIYALKVKIAEAAVNATLKITDAAGTEVASTAITYTPTANDVAAFNKDGDYAYGYITGFAAAIVDKDADYTFTLSGDAQPEVLELLVYCDSTARPATADTTWYNANETTFTLMDQADLLGFNFLLKDNNFEGKTVQLGADIALNEGVTIEAMKTAAPANVWNGNTVFKGIFDGGNYTISGLYISSTVDNTGLFGTASGEIKNLNIDNSYIAGTSYIGGIAGASAGTLSISNCVVDAYLVVTERDKGMGGIIGNAVGTVTISNCAFVGEAYAGMDSTKAYIGGIAGKVNSGNTLEINNCVVTATFTMNKTTCAGGFLGHVQAGSVTINSSVFAGEIVLDGSKREDSRSSGVVSIFQGANAKLSVNDCAILGKITVNNPKSDVYISVGAFGGSMNASNDANYTVSNTLVAIDLGGHGQVFSMAYNGVETFTKDKDARLTVTCTNVYYLTDKVNNENLAISGFELTTDAPTGVTAKTAAEVAGDAGATALGANWTAVAGDLPIPTAVKALYEKVTAAA